MMREQVLKASNYLSNKSGKSRINKNIGQIQGKWISETEENDPSEDAYLIYSFNGSKSVNVKTAAFADVPDDGFQEKKFDIDLCPIKTESSFPTGPVYGEAFWVGEDESPLELKPPSPRTARYVPIVLPRNKSLLASSSLLNITTSRASQSSGYTASIKNISNPCTNSNSSFLSNCDRSLFNGKQNQGNVIKLVLPSRNSQQKSSNSLSSQNACNATTSSEQLQRPASDEEEPEQMDGPEDFDSKNMSQRYMTYRSSVANKTMRCPSCGRHYRNAYSLNHHICSPRKAVWRRGDVTCHIIDGQQVYFCPICDRPFKWLGNLTRHYYVHTGQRFFKCEICSKEFFSSYQVKRHMNSHTGLRYKCEICDKPFTCKYACAWHTRQHFVGSTVGSGGTSAIDQSETNQYPADGRYNEK